MSPNPADVRVVYELRALVADNSNPFTVSAPEFVALLDVVLVLADTATPKFHVPEL